MQIEWNAVVSAPVLVVSLYIIVFRRDDQKAREWAYGAVGLILGYWLRY